MSRIAGCIAPIFTIFVNLFLVDLSHALSLSYSYEGNNFTEFTEVEGEPGKFSADDRVSAKFNINCALAHSAGNCIDLPFGNYYQGGAVELTPHSFTAGPASLPVADGSAIVTRFSFSTDAVGNIVDWDMELVFDDINVDTDNVGDGLDSAAVYGSGAVVRGQPGAWVKGPPSVADRSDILVEKTVDNPVPAGAQQTVEFTVEVSNTGSGPAHDVVVVDKLPADLAIAPGMAVFTSVGIYDPESGRWEIGEIDVGAKQLMSIPAVIVTEPQPACLINSATAYLPVDRNSANNSSSVALRRPDIERCVDLWLEVTDWYQASFPCEPEGRGQMVYQLKVSNSGLDEARDVVLEISETLYKAPGLRIEAPDCDGLRCSWPTLAAGAAQWVTITTDGFQIQAPTQHAIEAMVSSDIEDYPAANNSLNSQQTLVPFLKAACTGPDFDFNIGGGAGGCFIATATYGSPLHPQVQILREFRDSVLLSTEWGQKFVELYYRHSPGLARYIAERDGLRILVRGLLAPVVFTVAYPWLALLVVILLSAMLCAGFAIRRKKLSPGARNSYS